MYWNWEGEKIRRWCDFNDCVNVHCSVAKKRWGFQPQCFRGMPRKGQVFHKCTLCIFDPEINIQSEDLFGNRGLACQGMVYGNSGFCRITRHPSCVPEHVKWVSCCESNMSLIVCVWTLISSCWRCLGQSQNISEVVPCWRNYIAAGPAWKL